jgi:hypothetical protein
MSTFKKDKNLTRNPRKKEAVGQEHKTALPKQIKMDYWIPASEMLVGVRQNQMIINGIVYCDFCWCIRPDDMSPCGCLAAPVRSCEDCANSKDPCIFCNPSHHANFKAAMAALEELMEPYRELEEQWNSDDDADYNEHRFEY